MKISKKILYYFLLGLLIRLFLMPFFTHWDLPASYEMAHYITYHKIKDIYTYIYQNFNNSWAAVYPPITFFSFAFYLFLLKPLMPFFNLEPHMNLNELFYPTWLSTNHAFRYLFLLKLPYLFADLLIAYLLTQFFEREEQKIKVLKYWLFCPIVLYVNFIFAGFDVIPTLFVVLSLLLLKRKKIDLSFLSLGIAIAIKNYPFLFLIPTLIIIGGNLFKRIKYLILSLGPFFLSIVPFINKFAFRESVLYSETSRFFFKNKINVGEGDSLIPFFICYGLIVIYFMVKKIKEREIFENVILADFLVLISFYSFVYFHPQWFIWIMPFLIIYLLLIPEFKYLYWGVIILFFPYLFHFFTSTTWFLFDVINLEFFHYLKSPKQLIFQFYNADNLLHILRSFLTATLLSSVILFLKKKGVNNENY